MNYTLNEQLKINALLKEKIRELHDEINRGNLSERQQEQAKIELKELQDLSYKNRLIRQGANQ